MAKIGVDTKLVTYEWGEYLKRAKAGEHFGRTDVPGVGKDERVAGLVQGAECGSDICGHDAILCGLVNGMNSHWPFDSKSRITF